MPGCSSSAIANLRPKTPALLANELGPNALSPPLPARSASGRLRHRPCVRARAWSTVPFQDVSRLQAWMVEGVTKMHARVSWRVPLRALGDIGSRTDSLRGAETTRCRLGAVYTVYKHKDFK